MLVQKAEKGHGDDEPSTSKLVQSNFVVGEPLGHGTFGRVWTVEPRKRPGQLLAMKELMRFSHPKYIEMELNVLRELGGTCNIMQIHAAFRDKDRVFVIMDYFPHDSIRDILDNISMLEILEYMRNLFIALQHLHKNGIIHRDIKPANFLYNRKLKKYSLIDFGLSQSFESASKENENGLTPSSLRTRSAAKRLSLSNDAVESPPEKRWRGRCLCAGQLAVCLACNKKPSKNVNKAGTPGFRAPEILMRADRQTPLIDIWSAGITMLSLICRKYPIFRPVDDADAIMQIAMIVGTSVLEEVAKESGDFLCLKPSYPGVDYAKLMVCARGGGVESLPPSVGGGCRHCARSIFGNEQLRKCICKDREPPLRLSSEEVLAVNALERCLKADPKSRYTAEMLISLLQ